MDARLLRIVLIFLVVALLMNGWPVLLGILPGDAAMSPFLGVMVGCFFLVGLVARVHRSVQNRNPHVARQRAHEERRERVTVRRPAEEVPLDRAPTIPQPDPDPALSWEGEA